MSVIQLLFTLLWGSLAARLASIEPNWPQWRGPERNGISKETGLLKAWPATGPRVLWSIRNLGEGYGSIAIQGDRLYTQGTKEGNSVVFALDRADGKMVWVTAFGPMLDQDRGNGPRGTPTIDNDRIYALNEGGDLACLSARDGSILWRRNILRDFNGRNPRWHISESPLVDGNNVIVTPGGSGASIAALDKATGKTVWTTRELSDPAGYSSCIVANVYGARIIMTITADAGVGVRASDGKLLWRYEPVANRTANITTPVFHDNKVFYSSAYDTGGVLLGLKLVNGEIKAEEIYFTREMMNHHGGVTLVDGYMYGFSNTILTCLEFSTGKRMWRDRSVGKGSLTYADGSLYLLSERNLVGLATATSEGYNERGRFEIEDQGRPSWAHPVVCAGRLYIRNQGTLTVYDIRSE